MRISYSPRFDVRLVLASVWLATVFVLAGCPSPNVYGTGRTIPVGQFQHTVAVEGIGVSAGGAGAYLPTLPTYQFRVGVHDRIDIGARLANLTSLGADAKFNFLRGTLDLAVVPGFTAFYATGSAASGGTSATSSAGVFYGNLPLIVGINAGEMATILLTPGVGVAATTSSTGGPSTSAASATGFYARMGLGVNVHFDSGFAVHPEVTFLYFPNGGAIVYSTGVAFQFGASPNFRRTE